MLERFTDLRQKEVINVCDGCRFGYVCDIEFDPCSGRIVTLIIPEEGKFWGVFCKEKEYRIPWNCIRKIGDDIILVEVNTEEILIECT